MKRKMGLPAICLADIIIGLKRNSTNTVVFTDNPPTVYVWFVDQRLGKQFCWQNGTDSLPIADEDPEDEVPKNGTRVDKCLVAVLGSAVPAHIRPLDVVSNWDPYFAHFFVFTG
jgi:hypothetical protein